MCKGNYECLYDYATSGNKELAANTLADKEKLEKEEKEACEWVNNKFLLYIGLDKNILATFINLTMG